MSKHAAIEYLGEWGMTPIPENIPGELKKLNRWANFRARPRRGKKGKYDKAPFISRPPHSQASTNKPKHWGSFKSALATHQEFGWGFGFLVHQEDGLVFLDLDGCVDFDLSAPHLIQPWAQRIIDDLDSYTEISPSGTGIRIVVHGAIPSDVATGIEMYAGHNARFVTITGQVVG